ncbi:undecaprenyl/decaprenyl-phosphate alpha-N-acetylglucosaminyl 1-phosphate transferase [Patescibacteria group bacterium]|nr:undecaprenyl/decaprenyl-phosphate alpha-N-acetylglucosaminyl 1-phosphate transferase [Patescibacteria group bacterium]
MFNLIQVNWTNFIVPLLVAGGLSWILTWLVKDLGIKYGWHGGQQTEQHNDRTKVRLGGVAIYLAFLIGFLVFVPLDLPRIGLLIGATIIFIMGLADDLYPLPAWIKIIIQVIAVGLAIKFGIRVEQINNPLGGVIVFPAGLGVLISAGWLFLTINTINVLDGLDGLAGGMASIFAVVLFWLSLFMIVNQPEMALMAVLLLGSVVGFLYWNWYPAKIFMGDSGSNLLGFLIGALAIISGGKLATASLILGFPILDLLWSGWRRMRQGRSPFSPDREHLHHRLLAAGVTHPTVVKLILATSAAFGVAALLAGAWIKLLCLALVGLIMIILIRTVFLPKKIK